MHPSCQLEHTMSVSKPIQASELPSLMTINYTNNMH